MNSTPSLLETRLERYKNTYGEPTLVLIDMAHLYSETVACHKLNSEIYDGSCPDFPKITVPSKLSEHLLLKAFYRYAWTTEDSATFYSVTQDQAFDVIERHESESYQRINKIRCQRQQFTCFEMENIINANPSIRRIVLMADDRSYVPIVYGLSADGYSIMLIKHSTIGDNRPSVMPPDIPFQYSHYLIDEAFGLERYDHPKRQAAQISRQFAALGHPVQVTESKAVGNPGAVKHSVHAVPVGNAK